MLPALLPACLALVACAPRPATVAPVIEPPLAEPSEAPVATLLNRGEPVRRELAAGEADLYILQLDSPTYLRLRAEQRGIDLALALYGPDGDELTRIDGPGGRWVEELLSAVTAAGGEHRLEVAAREGEEEGRGGVYELVLEELRPSGPEDGTLLAADALLQEGVHLRQVGTREAVRSATERFEQAIAFYRSSGAARGEAEALCRLGESESFQGENERSADVYRQAAERSTTPRWHIQAESGLGWVLFQQGRLAEAEVVLARALASARDLGLAKEQADILNHLAALRLEEQRPREAQRLLEEALGLLPVTESPRQRALLLPNLGRTYRTLGDSIRAVEVYQENLELLRRTDLTEIEPLVLINLGTAYRSLGRYRASYEAYDQALRLAEAGGGELGKFHALNNLGILFNDWGRSQEALDYLGRALELGREQAPRYEAMTQMYLGWVYQYGGQASRALELFRGAREMSEATEWTRAYALQGEGRAYLDLNDARAALIPLREALELHKKASNPVGQVSTLLELGRVLRQLDQLPEALRNVRDALAVAQRLAEPSRRAEAWVELARIERTQGKLDLAREHLEKALSLTESLRGQIPSPDLRASYLSHKRERYELYIDLLMELAAERSSDELVATALAASERSRARALVELLAEAEIEVDKGIAPALKSREKQLADRLSSLQNQIVRTLSMEESNQTRLEELYGELERVRRQRELLELEIRQQHPRYAEVHYPETLDLPAIQRLLDERSALLEYALGDRRSFLFLVTREELRVYPLPGASAIAESVDRFYESIREGGRRRRGQVNAVSRELYRQLVEPAQDDLAEFDRLLIAPDRALYHLPFEALLERWVPGTSPGPEDFLLSRWAVGYVPSATVLASLRAPAQVSGQKARKALVAFGGSPGVGLPADRGDTEGRTRSSWGLGERWRWQQLPGSREEVEAISELFPAEQVQVYLGEEASEDNIKNNPLLSRARRIHFAAHGLLNEESPAHSALLLAPGTHGKEDGLLEVHEIFHLDLSAELVVLSACETALGKRLRGEGLVGLSHAFFYAGASSNLVSLWRVDDRSTAELMVKIYRYLSRGMSRIEAVRQAKLDLLIGSGYAHPYHWAPFVLVGEVG